MKCFCWFLIKYHHELHHKNALELSRNYSDHSEQKKYIQKTQFNLFDKSNLWPETIDPLLKKKIS